MDRPTTSSQVEEGSERPSSGDRVNSRSLAEIIADIKASVRKAGLSDKEIDAELEAYNAEGRNPNFHD